MHRAYTHKTQFTRNFPKVGKKNLSLYQISKSENKHAFWKQIFGGFCHCTGLKLWVPHVPRRPFQTLPFQLANRLCSVHSGAVNMKEMLAGHCPKIQNSVSAYLYMQIAPKFGLILSHDIRTKSHQQTAKFRQLCFSSISRWFRRRHIPWHGRVVEENVSLRSFNPKRVPVAENDRKSLPI